MYCTVVWMHKQFLFDIAEWDTVFFMTSGKLHKKVNGVTLHLYTGNKNNSALKRGIVNNFDFLIRLPARNQNRFRKCFSRLVS